jgi:NADH:ubiquinone oxidoreductase subunit 6 (subunit J)
MTLLAFIFYFFELLAALSAVYILFTRNVLYAALLLIICLLSLAGIYIMTGAEFLGVSQILIYAGGVLVLIIFGIMVTGKVAGKPLAADGKNLFLGISVGLGFLSLLSYSLYVTPFTFLPPRADHEQQHHIEQTGMLIMSDYVAPFELAGILLLISLVGAAVISSFTKTKRNAAR